MKNALRFTYAAALFSLAANPVSAQEAAQDGNGRYTQSPWYPYLSAHMNDDSPPEILGGPVEVTVNQDSGAGVTWVLPGRRELDPTIFGTIDDPKAVTPPPVGVPMEMREEQDDGTFITAVPVPASDEYVAVDGTLELQLVDRTATDAATTSDEISMVATFNAPENGGTYRIEVETPLSHGWYSPTLGGVATNVVMHGLTQWENQIMPTFFNYAAFWGLGDVYLDDELIAEERFIHGMLTEGIRGPGYEMVVDEEVNPSYRHFHLMGFPHTPQGEPNPIPTGFTTPGGQEQPFFHIMYEGTTTEAG